LIVLTMPRYAALSVNVSTAVHAAAVVLMLAWSGTRFEMPHYHMQRGDIFIQGTFALPTPETEALLTVALPPVFEETISQPIELAPTAIEVPPENVAIDTEVVLSDLAEALKAACDCPDPNHDVHTPKQHKDDITQNTPPRDTPREPEEQPVADAVPSSPAGSSVPMGADTDEPPRNLPTNRRPPYPPDAFRRGQEGRVILEFIITVEGTVRSVRVVESSGVASLDQSAAETAAGWRFEPASRGGRPVEKMITVPVRFKIRA
jgi:protein TonB